MTLFGGSWYYLEYNLDSYSKTFENENFIMRKLKLQGQRLIVHHCRYQPSDSNKKADIEFSTLDMFLIR